MSSRWSKKHPKYTPPAVCHKSALGPPGSAFNVPDFIPSRTLRATFTVYKQPGSDPQFVDVFNLILRANLGWSAWEGVTPTGVYPYASISVTHNTNQQTAVLHQIGHAHTAGDYRSFQQNLPGIHWKGPNLLRKDQAWNQVFGPTLPAWLPAEYQLFNA